MSFEACARIVERGDRDRFQAAMSVPLSARQVLMPIYAMNVEVARAPWVTKEDMIAEMRLQWWRDVLEEIAKGRPVRRHEVTTPLSQALTPDAARLADRAIAARRWDIYRDPFDDWDALRRYLEDTTGALMSAASLSLGRSMDLQDKGFGVGLARYLLAIPALISNGRRPLPTVERDDLMVFIDQGLQALRPASRQPECREAFLARNVLRRAARAPQDVLDRLAEPAPHLRSALLLKAALLGA
ncbi:MAG: squalene/phytoene synthase family protein [Pseudomonadota bacterium]